MEKEGPEYRILESIDTIADVKNVKFVGDGLGMANIHDPELNRSYRSALMEMKSLIDKGVVGTKNNWRQREFDDTKFRLHSYSIKGDTLLASVAPTWHGRVSAEIERSDELNKALIDQGTQESEPWKYFSRSAGVAAAVQTRDGNFFVAFRNPATQYSECANFPAGFCTFQENPETYNFKSEVSVKIWEKLGIEYNELKGDPRFVGMAEHPLKSNMDFCFIHQTHLGDNYFESGTWKERRDGFNVQPVFTDVVKIDTKEKMQALTNGYVPGDVEPRAVLYSTRLIGDAIVKLDLIK